MKKHIHKLTKFTKKIGKGIRIEIRETIEIPSLIRQREYRKAADQIVDIVKMAGLTVIWIVPGGAVATTVILKFSHKFRPSAFHPAPEVPEDSKPV
jgi:hypothetical protein